MAFNMKLLQFFKKKMYTGFSPIIVTICFGIFLFAVGYYFLAYQSKLTPSVTLKMPQILRSEESTGKVIEAKDNEKSYDNVSPQISDLALELDLFEGQNSKVLGTDIFIKAVKVDDLTGRGCLGGPLGCADKVDLEVSRHLVRKNITLYSPKSSGVHEAGKDKAVAFEYTISLLSIKDKKVTVRVEVIE